LQQQVICVGFNNGGGGGYGGGYQQQQSTATFKLGHILLRKGLVHDLKKEQKNEGLLEERPEQVQSRK
jgi:hypothetical protein